jgi:2',5'-phosphodiesterase
MVLIVSYNILSASLRDTKCYGPDHYDENVIKFENCFPVMVAKFEPFMKAHAIFCLQEVDRVAASKFQLFFSDNDYEFVYQPSGWKGNGYMGVALAVPRSYRIKNIDRFCLIDGKFWPKIVDKSPYGAHLLKSASWGWLDYTDNEYAAWKYASRKNNFMLTVEIVNNDSSFFVSCVHEPCDWRNPGNMDMFCSLTKDHIQQLAKDKPYILAGDFNIKPHDEAYKAMTEMAFDWTEINKTFPPEDTWRPTLASPVKSAVKVRHGREPAFTNSAHTLISGRYFQETLDYIFIRPDIKVVESFINFHKVDDLYYPDKDEPSDHLMIWAELEF